MSNLSNIPIVNKLEDVQPGKAIKTMYTATKGAYGSFSFNVPDDAVEIIDNLETPNGYFYFICIGYNNIGDLKLVADRVIQNKISWETLNTAGLCTVSGATFNSDHPKTGRCTIRIPVANTKSTTIENINEWTAITVGDNLVNILTSDQEDFWNINSINSWAMNTPMTNMSNRVILGDTVDEENGVVTISDRTSTYIGADVGFRPVLNIPDFVHPVNRISDPFYPECNLKLIHNVKKCQVGQAIPCRYTVTEAGKLGTFSLFGLADGEVIPDRPGYTPDGVFFFVCVGYEPNGMKKFVADRVIQTGISWETLNNEGLCTFPGKDAKSICNVDESKIRILTSGIVRNDMNKESSEWDKIIYSDTVGSSNQSTELINNWNHEKTRSWMMNTPGKTDDLGNAADMSYRVYRGKEDQEYRYNVKRSAVSTFASDSVGFRPVLIAPEKIGNTTYPECKLEKARIAVKAKPGQAVPCAYTVMSPNTFGEFSSLGTSVKDVISDRPPETPNGTFYFVCVGYEPSGALKFVADRVIQNSISWEVLNNAGLCTFSGRDVSSLTGVDGSTMRLLTSNIVRNDQDRISSEWDYVIYNDNIGGTDISSELVNDWNYEKTKSWMMNTPSVTDDLGNPANMSYRITRGAEDRGYKAVIKRTSDSNFASLAIGFRPVLTIPINGQNIVMSEARVTPTHIYKRDAHMYNEFVLIPDDATIADVTFEYFINDQPLNEEDNIVHPLTNSIEVDIPYDRLNTGENIVSITSYCLGKTKIFKYKIIKEIAGDKVRYRDYPSYTGGFELNKLSLDNNAVIGAKFVDDYNTLTRVKLPSNLLKIEIKE